MKKNRYSLSFTAASLMPLEMQLVAKEYLASQKNWQKAKEHIIQNNLLQKASSSTLKRKLSEYKKRCLSLNENELHHLVHSEEKKIYTFLSILKTYPLIYEFCTELLLAKYHHYESFLTERDWQEFIEAKKNCSNLASKSQTTLKKAYQVIRHMLIEVGMINNKEDLKIVKIYLSKEALKIICQDNPKWLLGFLYTQEEIKDLCKEHQ